VTEIDRVYKITVIRAPELRDTLALNRSFFEEFETITEIEGHDIQLKVEKHLRREPNTADLVIYNLSSVTRDEFTRSVPMKVRIEAGYDNTPRLLFLGDLRYASNELSGTEWLTKIQLGDGARAFSQARVNRTYATKTPISTIIGDIAKAFGVAVPSEVTASPELRTRISAGEAIVGYAADELTRILTQFGFEWSFQGGRLQILRFDQASPGLIRVISQDDGMLGTPVIDPPKIRAAPRNPSKKVKVPKLTVQHTLFPELTPGEKCEVRSRSINGTFRIDDLTHELDSRGDEWTSTLEATEV
jgi:hypothetical protein